MGALYDVSPAALNRLRFRLAWGRWPDLRTPTTFDEKLQWLNLFWQDPLKIRCGDKFGLRGMVEQQGLGHLLTQLYGVYASTGEIGLESLPDRFVLKCSHGCKCNVFCADSRHFDWAAAKAQLDGWMRTDFSRLFGELHYSGMTRRILCEEFLGDGPGFLLPTDYKVFCSGGRPFCSMVATARNPNGIARLAFYDLDWKLLPNYCLAGLSADDEIPRPASYDEMIRAAEVLSRPFPFVRVDFYDVGGRARLGELTFTPGACVSANYLTETAQMELGRLVELPRARREGKPE